jgi:hypothetical protein
MATNIFISYARSDSEFADRISADLLLHGYNAWMDRRRLEAGTDWADRIQQALLGTSAVLVLISRASLESVFVRSEYRFAAEHEKKVIPLLLQDVDRMPLDLSSIQLVDFRRDYQSAFATLLRALPESTRLESVPTEIPKPKSNGYFFISYAEEDTEFVEGMRGFLRDRKYGFWDYQESERDYDTHMFIELERQISQASAMFCILSPDWKLSRWAPKEYLFATEIKVPTFLLMVREMGPTLIIAGVPYIDFIRDPKKGFAKLDRELRRKRLIS